MLLFAAMIMGLVSCGKDDDGIGNGLPTFATLYSYIGRTDLDAIMAEFSSKGYDVWMENEKEEIVANMEKVECYVFHIKNGKVIGASYGFENKADQTKSLLLSKLDEEKKFRSQSGLMQYEGGFLLKAGNERNYSNKDELIAALKNLDLSTVDEGWSGSTYSDVKTSFTFGGYDGFEYRVKQN